MSFTEKQIEQMRDNWQRSTAKRRSAYERSANGKAWFFYPCDDHVITVTGRKGEGWTAILTPMTARNNALCVGTGHTRRHAVESILNRVI